MVQEYCRHPPRRSAASCSAATMRTLLPLPRPWWLLLFALAGCVRRSGTDVCVHGVHALVPLGTGSQSIRTVFVILMENRDWSSIAGSSSAPYINSTLLSQASYATRY